MHTKKILVVGGAGYIGSHMVAVLQDAGFDPIVLDDLSTGHRHAVKDAEFVMGDMADDNVLETIFTKHKIQAVMHFAAFIQVNESVKNPAKYYLNNVAGTLKLLQAMLKHGVNQFIFSSTAAVFGEPRYTPMNEDHPQSPVNAYGSSKLMVEKILQDYTRAYPDFRFMTLRYFNAAGAHPNGKLGEWHEPETHLIPVILEVASGKRSAINIFGTDYPTPDGTCIRDYVHVMDLCEAHLLALQALMQGKKSNSYNLGTGHGFSIRQVIDCAREVTKCDIKTENAERREGDPTILVADPSLAIAELNWQPKYADLPTIIAHAWQASRMNAELSSV